MSITVEATIGPGEFFDRMSILKIKTNKLSGVYKLQATCLLSQLKQDLGAEELLGMERANPALHSLVTELYRVNGLLWDEENEIREWDRMVTMAEAREYFRVSKAIREHNRDRRATKAAIDKLLESMSFSDPKRYTGET